MSRSAPSRWSRAIDELADRARAGPDRAADPQRAREGPELGPAVLRPSPRRGVARGRRALRLGAASGAGHAPGGRMADRHGLRERDLSLPPLSRRRARGSRSTKTGHATVEVPANDMGMGTSTTQTIVTAERLGLPLERVTVAYGDSSFPGSMLAGGSSADGLDHRRGDRGPARARRAAARARRRRLAPGRADRRRGRGSRRGAVRARRPDSLGELLEDPANARAATS